MQLRLLAAVALLASSAQALRPVQPLCVRRLAPPSRRETRLHMSPAVARAARTMHLFTEQLISALTSFSILSLTHLMSLRSSTVIGGLLAGSLHAVTGPDHIAALLPASVGQRWHQGLRIGASWGLGHGLSATLIGLFGFLLKDRLGSHFSVVEKLSGVAESAVGISLVLIGGIGLREALDAEVNPEDDSAISSPPLKSKGAIFTNGILHGFSWDGAPSLAPALTLSSWRSAMLFLFSYSIGTMVAMSATAGAVGEGTRRLGKASKSPELPRKMSIISSCLAIAIGCFWIYKVVRS